MPRESVGWEQPEGSTGREGTLPWGAGCRSTGRNEEQGGRQWEGTGRLLGHAGGPDVDCDGVGLRSFTRTFLSRGRAEREGIRQAGQFAVRLPK